MSRHTTAAPYSRASFSTRSRREPSLLAVLEVGRVEHRPTADPLQTGLHHVGFGGVEHEGSGHSGGKPAGQLIHIGGAVTPHIVDAQIQQVGALAHLVTGDLEAAVPVGLQHGVAELAGAVGISALAYDQERCVLGEGHGGVDGGGRRGQLAGSGSWREIGAAFYHRPQVFGGGATAPADHVDPQFGHVAGQIVGELVGADVVVHPTVHHLGEPGVGDTCHRNRALLGEHSQVLAHLGRAGGAVQPEHRRAQRGQGGQRGADLSAREHTTGHLDGDLHLQRNFSAHGGHGPAAAVDGRFGPEEVVLGFDEEEVHPAIEQTPGLHLEGIAQFGVADLA